MGGAGGPGGIPSGIGQLGQGVTSNASTMGNSLQPMSQQPGSAQMLQSMYSAAKGNPADSGNTMTGTGDATAGMTPATPVTPASGTTPPVAQPMAPTQFVGGTNLMGLPSWFSQMQAANGGAWGAQAPATPSEPPPPNINPSTNAAVYTPPAAKPKPTASTPVAAKPAVGTPGNPVAAGATAGYNWAPKQGAAPDVSFLPPQLRALLEQNPGSFVQGGPDYGQTMRAAGQTPQQQQALQDYVRWSLGEIGYGNAAAQARSQYDTTMNRRTPTYSGVR